MATIQGVDWRTSSTWKSYRHAFENFRAEVHRVQSLGALASPPREELDGAVVRLQIASEDYRIARNALLWEMVPPEHHSITPMNDDIPFSERVKETAELLWELEGRPNGSALDDWYRAEAIVRRSSTGVL